MARVWCKVSSSLDSHPKIRRAGNLGRQVFEFALRRNAEVDRNGVIPAEHFDPDYLADVLMLTKEQAVSGLSQAVRTGLLARDTSDELDNYVICGWDDEWGRRPMTEAERKRNQRASKRTPTSVTNCPDTERDCPDSHAGDQRRGDQIREEEKREIPARRQRAAKHRLDPLWIPADTEANRKAAADAKARGVNLEQELLKLHDWALSSGKTGVDWDARWRNWLRESRPNGAQRMPPKSALELQLERVDTLEARDRARNGGS